MTTSYLAQSVAAQTLAPLTTLSTALDTIQQTLQTSTTYSALSATTDTLLIADDSLTSALELLQRQQDNLARILALQSQVLFLENQLKDTIRRARTLRKEITDIHPSIDNDDDDDGDADQPEVDYQSLLHFAARIGKHNAVAKLEAEQQGEQLKLEAIKARKKSEQLQAAAAATATTTAGEAQNNGVPTSTPSQQQLSQHQDPTSIADKIDREAAELSLRSHQWHSMSRLPFPAPALLRKGDLGTLQVARESDPGDPEGAADREAEKLVRMSEEGIAPDEGMARRRREREVKEREEAWRRRVEREAAAAAAAKEVDVGGSSMQKPQQQEKKEEEQPKPTKKLNLDFPGDYGDDSDDD